MNTKVNALTPKQERFVTEYLQSGNLTESAKKAKVSKNAVYRWYEKGLADVISARQKKIADNSIKTMQTATLKATQFLVEVLQNEKLTISDRLRAADLLTRNGLKAWETDKLQTLAEIETELKRLTNGN